MSLSLDWGLPGGGGWVSHQIRSSWSAKVLSLPSLGAPQNIWTPEPVSLQDWGGVPSGLFVLTGYIREDALVVKKADLPPPVATSASGG